MNNADLIIKSKAIFDSVNEKPFEGWVAVKGNKIIDVGTGADCIYEKDCKNVHDVGNKTVMYAFHDNHVHFLMAGMYKTCVNLADAKNEEEAAKMVKDFYDKNGAGDWVLGFGWYHVFWDNKTTPSKKSLDKYFPDIPVFLLNAEAHGAWVNSKAMEIAGITKDIPDPEFGIIERYEDGEPKGFLYEGATGLAAKYALVLNPEQEKKTIKAFMEDAKTLGITSITDVMPYFGINMGHLDIYHEMDVDNELTVRVHAAPDVLGDLDEAEKWRAEYNSEKLRVDHLKQFLDGVSTTQTALLIEPYSNNPDTCGTSLFDLESIGKAIPEAHKRGFSVKLHSCGDMSCRIGLNYFENAIKMYGKNKCRHAIEHCELVDPTDLPRFKELGVIPSVQPEHIALTQEFKENPYLVTMGTERAGRTWPLLSLYKQAGRSRDRKRLPRSGQQSFPRNIQRGSPDSTMTESQKAAGTRPKNCHCIRSFEATPTVRPMRRFGKMKWELSKKASSLISLL